jgi:endonuclease G, mitochondrial
LRLHRFLLASFLLFATLSCSPSERAMEESRAYAVAPDEDYGRAYVYAGNPDSAEYPNRLQILYSEGFVVGYDNVRGLPAWVAYRVFDVDDYDTHSRPGRFLIDVRSEKRISHDDYTHSGYDRGHMAPNFAIDTRFGEDAQRETFMMTNIIPQKPSLNRHLWARIERLIARDYSEKYDEVWVLTGPVFKESGNWINDRVKIPTHNFMIIMTEDGDELKMIAFLVHQDVESSEAPEPYLTSVRHIEEITGLNFNPFMQTTLADSLEQIEPESLWKSD